MLATPAFVLAAEGESIIKLDATLFFILLLFLVFVFLLNRVLFKPIGRVLDERETLTDGATAEARAARLRYQVKLDDYEARIREARAETYRRLEQERAAALDKRKQLTDEAKAQATGQIEQAKAELSQQVAGARATLETESRQIAQRISTTVLGRAISGGGD